MQNKTVGQKIKEKRLEKGLTQKQLGDLCVPKMNDSAIRRYESGNVAPKMQNLKRIAKALDVSVIELLSDTAFTDEDENFFTLLKNAIQNHKDSKVIYQCTVEKKSNKENQIIDDSLPENLSSIPESELDIIYTESVNSLMEDLKPEGKAEIAKYTKYIYSQPEYRKESDATTPIAAHNDNVDDEEQQKLMKEDIDEL